MSRLGFQEFLNEIQTHPSDITWVKTSSKWYGEFDVILSNGDSESFEISINKNDDYSDYKPVWEFKFTRNSSTKLIDDNKYQFRVYSTIKKAIYDFINDIKPEIFAFISVASEQSRFSLYRNEAKLISSKFDYKNVIKLQGDYYVFVLCLEEIDAKEVAKVLDK